MTNRTDIIDGAIAAGRKYGLIYTKQCGWVDLGHANPTGASGLWHKILADKDEGGANSGYYRISYKQTMGRKNVLKVGVIKKFDIKKGLALEDKKSVALAIFMDVSHQFEAMQSNWLFRLATNSGYSAEDLVSNLIGFYRAIYPNKNFLSLCQPVTKNLAYEVWDKFGAVGSNKNYTTVPYIYPVGGSGGGPMSAPLPHALSTIKPAKAGVIFKEAR